MKKIDRKIIFKLITIIISIAIVAFVIIQFIPIFNNLGTKEGQIEFKAKIKNMGIKGIILLYLLEAAQMILVILPGEPIEVLYGMCYGTILGAVLLTVAVFINTIIICFLVKKIGRNVLVFLFSEEKIKKVENNKLFKDPNKIEYALILLFFLPGTPKDLILYIGALSPIKIKKTILISTFVRFPSVITSTMAGNNIISGNLYIAIGIYIITAVMIAIIMIIQKKKNTNILML